MSGERIVSAHGVELCTQTFGDADDPAILLIAGMSSSMDWWEDGFCRRLADGGRYVVRYDLRDTGRSTTDPPGEPGYTTADLRDDAIGLLDALGIGRAHLVGVSMGGGLAQALVVEHPDRVGSLTLIDTTGALPGMPEDLPGIEPALAAYLAEAAQRPEPDWSDRAAAVEQLVADQRALMRAGFDETRVRALAGQVVDRTRDMAAMTNHELLEPGRDLDGSLADIAAPTLVVHGTADPLFPPAHGEALTEAIPNAALLTLPGVGHEHPPPAEWDRVVTALRRITSRDYEPAEAADPR